MIYTDKSTTILLSPSLPSDELLSLISHQSIITDEEGCFPEESFKAIAAAGLLEVVLPGKALDYNDAKTGQLLQLLKQIGSADLSTGRIYEGHINALYLIHLFAKKDQKQCWHDDIVNDKRLFGVWNTQAGDGIKIHALDNGKYRLEGAKTFCSGAGNITRPLITGELLGTPSGGWQMCIIPKEKVSAMKEDTSFWKPLGMRSSVSYRMDFTGVEIDEKDLLGKPGDYYHQPVFSGGAIRFAAVQLGGAEGIFNATKEYLQSLGRTDDVFQRARIAEITCLVAAGDNWLQMAGEKTDDWLKEDMQTDRIIAYANMTRTCVEEICLRVMQLAERCVGARGLMKPGLLEKNHRDLTFYLRQPAPDATLTAIGEYVLGQKKSAHELWR